MLEQALENALSSGSRGDCLAWSGALGLSCPWEDLLGQHRYSALPLSAKCGLFLQLSPSLRAQSWLARDRGGAESPTSAFKRDPGLYPPPPLPASPDSDSFFLLVFNPIVNHSEREGGERRRGRARSSPPSPRRARSGSSVAVTPPPRAPFSPSFLPLLPPPLFLHLLALPPAPSVSTPSPRHSPARHANHRRRRLPLAAARSFNGSPGPAYGCWAPRATGSACASAPSARPQAGSGQLVLCAAAQLSGSLHALALAPLSLTPSLAAP